MKFFSYVKDGFHFTPVEVQVSFLPGLPEVKFTGLVDMAIKESAIRLKSAFKQNNFQWPSKKQIIVNLSPSYIKKSSPGMDLAIACAILEKTAQVSFSHYNSSELYFYGELDLTGNIHTPKDWRFLPSQGKTLTIGSLCETNYKQDVYLANTLRDLPQPQKSVAFNWKERLKPPAIQEISFSKSAAEVLKICATGEHHTLLCGSAGSGKSTLAEHVYSLLAPPTQKTFEQMEQILNLSQEWRSFINPHHTTSPLSMIGGGSPLFLGEVSKAHGGLLLLDEYLEFHPRVQEALREPLEKGEIRLVRRGQCMVFPSQFLLVATSNLCPCGDYEPYKPVSCSYSLRRCQSYLDRLSGPMMDRFDLLSFSKDWKGDKTVSLKSLKKEVELAQLFRLEDRGQEKVNAHLDLNELETMMDDKIKNLLPEDSSHRRKRALIRVARTLSDLKQEKKISSSSLEQAIQLTVKNFFFLKNRILGN